jgi:adenylate kinase
MNILFLGAPGVGKGTCISKIKEIFNLVHISTGDIFRENIKNKTELGIKAKNFIDQGKLVPDSVTIDMTKNRLQKDDAKKGYILDGFPRTITQADALNEFTKINVVINMDVKEEEIIMRLSNRRLCKSCNSIFNLMTIKPKKENICDKCGGELYQRDDDKEDAIKQRLQVYENQTQPLINYYKEKGLLQVVDANTHDINSIINNIKEILDKINN